MQSHPFQIPEALSKFPPAFRGRNQSSSSSARNVPEAVVPSNPGISKYFFRGLGPLMKPCKYILRHSCSLSKNPCGKRDTALAPRGARRAGVGGSSITQKRPSRRPLSPSEAHRPAAPGCGQSPADAGSPAPPRWRPTSPRATSGKVRSYWELRPEPTVSTEPTGTRRDARWATRSRTRELRPAQPGLAPGGPSST